MDRVGDEGGEAVGGVGGVPERLYGSDHAFKGLCDGFNCYR